MSVILPATNLPDSTSLTKKEEPTTIEFQPHQAEILSIQFSPSGRTIATASADKTIQLTSVYDTQNRLLTLKGHKGAVLELRWSGDGDRILSCSSDRNAIVWDLITGQRFKKLVGHEDIVNSCDMGKQLPNIAVTGSDDGNTLLWDLRILRAVASFPERYQVLSVAMDDTTYRIFSGSLDNKIRVFDVRKYSLSSPNPRTEDAEKTEALLFSLNGHVNAITGIALSSNNNLLVSNSMDQTVRLWDVRPFCARGNHLRCFASTNGPIHNFEQTLHRVRWAPDNLCVSAGSADRCAYIFHTEGVETQNQPFKLLYKLPGHTGAVTEVAFHPCERTIASASTDRKVFIKKLG